MQEVHWNFYAKLKLEVLLLKLGTVISIDKAKFYILISVKDKRFAWKP